jgi:hypothetical protein
MANSFQHQDGATVPLVWQHGHSDVENVLGHAILTNKPEGVWADCYFNATTKAAHARTLVEHKDITALSIWANQLVERGGHVLHGVIRELSLVLSGANPEALIKNVVIQHSGDPDYETELEDEAIIYTGLTIVHSDTATSTETKEKDMGTEDEGDGPTVKEVYDDMTEEQQAVVHFLVGQALEEAGDDEDGELEQDALTFENEEDVAPIVHSMTDAQRAALDYLVSEALATTGSDDSKGNKDMKHNVFESGTEDTKKTLSHDAMKEVIAAAAKGGSLKHAVEDYALAHGITDIDVLFPEAQALDGTPQWNKRRTEWVDNFLSSTTKSPFSRIKTISADITPEEARAKGYVKGNLKREEFFQVTGRSTTPTTIYKKQKLDRDDVIDITDFDVVTWVKGEMRIMLDEELARAAMIGDGRDISHQDKINEQNIRPIASDHELFTTTVNVNIDDGSSSVQEIVDALILNRRFYKGTGLPTFFTTETYIAKFLLLKDTTGRRLYNSLAEVALDLRVAAIVPVEVMEEEADLVGIMVNPIDYVIGTDRGGEVNMFDDFDIDYNNLKFLIETRCSGALNKLKSAIVVRKVASTVTLLTPTVPTFNTETGVVTIPTQTGTEYQDASDDSTLTAGAQAALDLGDVLVVNAVPASASYAFNTSEDDTWTFTGVTAL